MVGFFFWRQGSSLQNSLSGLFRSMVHDILEACPNLIPDILPSYWAAVKDSPMSRSKIEIPAGSIMAALVSLMDHTHVYASHRLCLVIDGLDEYVETEITDYRALVDMISSWVRRSDGNLKICVSSREENVFMNAFPGDQRVRLHDLTHQDMRHYTRDLLVHIDSDVLLTRLSSEIPKKSNGIFLWAALVVRTIRKEIEAEASEQRLIEILDQLPEGLDALFQYILQGLDKHHRTRLLRTISMLNKAKTFEIWPWGTAPPPFLLTAYSFFDDYDANPEFATLSDFNDRFPTLGDLKWRVARTEKQLRNTSGGLIEVVDIHEEFPMNLSRLEFVHRSVPEVFEQGPLAAEMAAVVDNFDACGAFAKLYLAALRFMNGPRLRSDGVCSHLVAFLLDNFNDETFTLLRYIDACIDPFSFGNLPDRTSLSMQFTSKFSIGVIRPIDPPNITQEPLHFSFFNTLCLAAFMAHLPFFEWKYTQSSDSITAIEKRVILILTLLGRNAGNRHFRDFLFNTGFFDDPDTPSVYSAPFCQHRWYLTAGDGLTSGQYILLAHCV